MQKHEHAPYPHFLATTEIVVCLRLHVLTTVSRKYIPAVPSPHLFPLLPSHISLAIKQSTLDVARYALERAGAPLPPIDRTKRPNRRQNGEGSSDDTGGGRKKRRGLENGGERREGKGVVVYTCFGRAHRQSGRGGRWGLSLNGRRGGRRSRWGTQFFYVGFVWSGSTDGHFTTLIPLGRVILCWPQEGERIGKRR